MTRLITTPADAGRSCPYCRFPLKAGDVAELCDSCNSLHHEDCWSQGHGCAVRGCSQAGTAFGAAEASPPTGWSGHPNPTGAPVPSVGPATQVHPGYGVPPGHGAPSAHSVPESHGALPRYLPPQPLPLPRPRSGNQMVLVLAAIIALLGIGTSIAVATGAFSGGARATTPKPARKNMPTTPTTPTAPVAPGLVEQASDRQAIVDVLDAYQSAYSDHNISGLANIFAPEIVRHGLAAGGCIVSKGRSAVLSDYQSQFEEGSGSYKLIGLSEGQVQFEGKTRAHVDAHYQITPGGSGYVNFKFTELGAGWKIGEVYATCA
jgi:hypothetical protein